MEPAPPEQPLETVLVAAPLETVLLAPPPNAPPPRPRVWTALLATAAYFAASLVVGGAAAALAVLRFGPWGPGGAPPEPAQVEALFSTPAFLLAGALLQCAVAAGIALLASGLSPEPLRARLALRRPALGPGALALACLGLLLTGAMVQELVAVLGIPVTGALAHFTRAVQGLSPAQLAVALAVGGGIVPIGEELFFRGYVQSRLCRRWGAWPGIAFTALAFGAAHLDWLHGASAAVAGVFLGWLAQRTGSTVPGIAVHAVNNVVAIALTWAVPEPALSRAGHAALLAAFAAATAVAVGGLVRRLPPAGGRDAPPETTTPPGPEA